MDSFFNFHTAGEILGLFRPPLEQRAYLDPGSGSFLIQLLVAALLGGLFLLKTYWRKITGFFGRLFSRGKDAQDDDE
jgi:hypothetical protein